MYVNDYITCTQYRTIYEREDLSSVFRTYYLQKCICYIHIMISGLNIVQFKAKYYSFVVGRSLALLKPISRR